MVAKPKTAAIRSQFVNGIFVPLNRHRQSARPEKRLNRLSGSSDDTVQRQTTCTLPKPQPPYFGRKGLL